VAYEKETPFDIIKMRSETAPKIKSLQIKILGVEKKMKKII
jgi:hypothetical protein